MPMEITQMLRTYLLTTDTDSYGFFSVPHGFSSQSEVEIVGITAAVQHKNGNWHTLEFSHEVDNRFWWNETVVEGLIHSPNFYNRPVRVIVFVIPSPR